MRSILNGILFIPIVVSLKALPRGISPYATKQKFEVQSEIRSAAFDALTTARADGIQLMEIEFPPLLGGPKGKSALDDFTNVDVLNANMDWTVEFSMPFADELQQDLWLTFPDPQELKLAKQAWPGKRFQSARFTTLEKSCVVLSDTERVPSWGEGFASTLQSIMGNEEAEEEEDMGRPRMQFVIQPGDGGPLEDWMNLEKLQVDGSPMVVVNGAFDKLRDGYYPPFLFPKLAQVTDRFIRSFETIYYLKPLLDKGVYGWLYRVYPEPWQVLVERRDGSAEVADVSPERPPYLKAIEIMKRAAPL